MTFTICCTYVHVILIQISLTGEYRPHIEAVDPEPPKSCITSDAFAITVADIGSALRHVVRKWNLKTNKDHELQLGLLKNAIPTTCPLHALLPKLDSHTVRLFMSNYLNPISATGAGAGHERTRTKVSRESKLLVKELDSRNMERTAIPQEAPTDH